MGLASLTFAPDRSRTEVRDLAGYKESLSRSACSAAPFLVALTTIACGGGGHDLRPLASLVTTLHQQEFGCRTEHVQLQSEPSGARAGLGPQLRVWTCGASDGAIGHWAIYDCDSYDGPCHRDRAQIQSAIVPTPPVATSPTPAETAPPDHDAPTTASGMTAADDGAIITPPAAEPSPQSTTVSTPPPAPVRPPSPQEAERSPAQAAIDMARELQCHAWAQDGDPSRIMWFGAEPPARPMPRGQWWGAWAGGRVGVSATRVGIEPTGGGAWSVDAGDGHSVLTIVDAGSGSAAGWTVVDVAPVPFGTAYVLARGGSRVTLMPWDGLFASYEPHADEMAASCRETAERRHRSP